MTDTARWIICLLAAYFVGSIPFGLLIGLARGIDIRQHGSKNIGATNAGRVLGREWGMLAFALDALKGAAPVALAGWWLGMLGRTELPAAQAWWWLGVAIAAILGHMFPLFLRFKGGKGVATGFGALAGLWPIMTWPALIALGAWLIALALTRYVSASSCIAAVTVPISVIALSAAQREGPAFELSEIVMRIWPFLVVSIALAAAVVWKHRANLARLRAGTEPKVGRNAQR